MIVVRQGSFEMQAASGPGSYARPDILALEEYRRRMQKEPGCQRITDESMATAAAVLDILISELKTQPIVVTKAVVSFDGLEERLLRAALDAHDGNQTQAAAALGITRDQVRYRMQKYKIRETPPAREETPAQLMAANGGISSG